MPAKIKPDVLKALEDWKAGKPVQSLELGHIHRMKDNGAHSPTIDMSVRLVNDQERAHAYCFAILEHSIAFPQASHDAFLAHVANFVPQFPELTEEERVAAESLAWKALHVGWQRAIAGHDPSMYIEVVRKTQESKVQAT